MPITTPPEGNATDASRRTWLAAERTWLAWWRTGLATGALAIAVGRALPALSGGARWPFRLLGLGYGALAVVVLVVGASRQARMAKALRSGDYEELSSPLVAWLSGAAVAFSLATMVIVAVAL